MSLNDPNLDAHAEWLAEIERLRQLRLTEAGKMLAELMEQQLLDLKGDSKEWEKDRKQDQNDN